METKATIAAIVPAAGVGSRMQHSVPKQYISLSGKTILQHTLTKLAQLHELVAIHVAVSVDDQYFADLPFIDKRIKRVDGGNERATSVLNGLLSLADNPPKWVLVHDAARPLVTIDDMNALLSYCLTHGEGGILATQVKDTIKRGHTHSEQTIPRDALWQALTPQLFNYRELLQSLQDALAANAVITDEASAMEWANKPVKLVAGRSDNIKITTPEDLDLAEFLLQQQESESNR
ncbi:2-C-methyl-D-erythritol 4-phosphate cytidylyltransferase [Pseudoalteromonas mariniglutinosa]|uniref:2-C-methyl-D-erythritol 4-phosphate cytidylyltransferase n=1 Tax=Pseudoalteromonas mariniglutinosa TaxID=206042 RepID=UPI00384A6BE2